MRQYYNLVTFGLLVLVGIFAKILVSPQPSQDGSYGPASANIWSYGTMACGVFGITLMLYSELNKSTSNTADLSSILQNETFFSILPALLLFIILGWIIALNVVYYTRINKGFVPPEYNTYNNISLLLTVMQSLIVFRYVSMKLVSKDSSDISSGFGSTLTSLSYLLSISNIFLAMIATIILEYFVTDG